MNPAEHPLLAFVAGVTEILAQPVQDDRQTLSRVEPLMRQLVRHDGWLAEPFRQPHPSHYQQYLLYGDPLERFTVVSFVWGPGQATPIHNHTVWGVIGMLSGEEVSTRYAPAAEGGPLQPVGAEERLRPGDTSCVSPEIGDVHRVHNAFDDRCSISIHVYGGNIGRIQRHVFDPVTGAPKNFVSGYANRLTPNLWAAAA